ncbi:hypothetical protein HDU76_001939 [Blyttiomyces sp. JEL0837]|nr:hypothetical protein HDU76_001939 [Blyttiomyces sp. JEL0837]
MPPCKYARNPIPTNPDELNDLFFNHHRDAKYTTAKSLKPEPWLPPFHRLRPSTNPSSPSTRLKPDAPLHPVWTKNATSKSTPTKPRSRYSLCFTGLNCLRPSVREMYEYYYQVCEELKMEDSEKRVAVLKTENVNT